MGQTRGKRVAGKKKPKSIKAKVTSKMSSKRRLSRMGKEMKKGQKGIVANYLTRSQVLRRLQISLRDFRRLCILKGIYPRDPKKKASGKDKAYYHIKDVGYLAHEPLLNKFREFKAFMKKVRKAVSRGDTSLALKREGAKPTYTVDHLVKERYPRFSDALGDLDDALSLVHLFATLPAEGPVHAERTERCRRLALEWQYYVARSHSLAKVFVSVKGVYFQAEVQGQPVTWVVPHNFTQVAPRDVDFRIMLTFLEFYETLLRFALFKLYHSLELAYPPQLDGRLDECGAYMAAVRGLPVHGRAPALAQADVEEEEEEGAGGSGGGKSKKGKEAPVRKVKGLEEKLARLAKGEGEVEEGGDEEEEEELPEGALSGPLGEAMEGVGMEEEEEEEGPDREVYRRQKEEAAKATLFKGLKFFLNREVPVAWMHFVISSFGGQVGWEGEGSPFGEAEKGITHQIVDRPVLREQRAGREYVQPQWVLDSVNARMLLPLDLYGPGKPLPPHLSPFVDDAAEGYVPAYREQLDILTGKAAATVYAQQQQAEQEEREREGGQGGEPQAPPEEEEEDQDRSEGEEEDEEEEEEEGQPAAGKRKKGGKGEGQEDEAKELARIMMPRKHQRLYQTAKRGQDKRAGEVEALKAKRRRLEQAQQPAEAAAAEAKKGAGGKGKGGKKQQKA